MHRQYRDMSYSHPQQQSWSFDGVTNDRRRRRRQNRQPRPQDPDHSFSNPAVYQEAGSQSRPQGQNFQPRYQNPFGTREEIESEDYQSPVAQMFGRAWMRYRDAEANRSNPSVPQQPSNPQTFILPLGPTQLQHAYQGNTLDDRINTVQENLDSLQLASAVPEDSSRPVQTHGFTWNPTAEHFSSVHNNSIHPRLFIPASNTSINSVNIQTTEAQPLESSERPSINPIDAQLRPPPLTLEQMTVSIACRICNEQKADTLFEPCMHVVVCHFCSVLLQDAARRRRRDPHSHPATRKWNCPMCRRDIHTVRRVYLG